MQKQLVRFSLMEPGSREGKAGKRGSTRFLKIHQAGAAVGEERGEADRGGAKRVMVL